MHKCISLQAVMHVASNFAGMHNLHMGDYKSEALAYLRSIIDQTGKTATELARLVEVSQTTLTRPLNSPDYKYAVKFQVLQALSQKTGILIPETLAAVRPAPRAPENIRLPIRYEVAASGFQEVDQMPQQPYGFCTVRSVRAYAYAPQWLERVISDSMNQLMPVGSVIHVVDAIAINYEPRHGDVVVVERRRGQGSLVERTVKQVEMTTVGPELWPRSHNPRWNQPISLVEGAEGSDDVEVQIVALVLQSYMFFAAECDEDTAEVA